MNQSIGANSFEKSLLEKCTDGWQQESTNELWKGSFSSVCSQTSNGQNGTNQVYENLLRICEEIDTALPEIRSTVDEKGELLINEEQSLDENKPPHDVFAHNVVFDGIGTSLEDIEIYEDILNASAMMENDDCIYNRNFDIMKTNQFLQCDTFNDFSTLPLPESMRRTQGRNVHQCGIKTSPISDRTPIFADDEIDQYLATRNFNFDAHFPISSSHKSRRRDEDAVDPLQFWHKLNCPKLVELPLPKESPTCESDGCSDKLKKSTKSILAILDFTLPSLSSSASSCALSSPEQKDIEVEPTISKTSQIQSSSFNKLSKHDSQSGLPVLVAESDVDFANTKKPAKKKKKKNNRNKNNPTEVLKQDLILSSPSSSESSLITVSDIKPLKKRKLNSVLLAHQKSNAFHPARHSDTKSSIRNKYKKESSPNPTSPTLKAGAIYIEQQLGEISDKKSTKIGKTQQTKCSVTFDAQHQQSVSKEIAFQIPKNSTNRMNKEKQAPKTPNTPNNSKSKSDTNKCKLTEDKKKSQCSSSSSASSPSPASMPPLKLAFSFPPCRSKKDENNNKLKPSQNTTSCSKPVTKMKDVPKNSKFSRVK